MPIVYFDRWIEKGLITWHHVWSFTAFHTTKWTRTPASQVNTLSPPLPPPKQRTWNLTNFPRCFYPNLVSTYIHIRSRPRPLQGQKPRVAGNVATIFDLTARFWNEYRVLTDTVSPCGHTRLCANLPSSFGWMTRWTKKIGLNIIGRGKNNKRTFLRARGLGKQSRNVPLDLLHTTRTIVESSTHFTLLVFGVILPSIIDCLQRYLMWQLRPLILSTIAWLQRASWQDFRHRLL